MDTRARAVEGNIVFSQAIRDTHTSCHRTELHLIYTTAFGDVW